MLICKQVIWTSNEILFCEVEILIYYVVEFVGKVVMEFSVISIYMLLMEFYDVGICLSNLSRILNANLLFHQMLMLMIHVWNTCLNIYFHNYSSHLYHGDSCLDL